MVAQSVREAVGSGEATEEEAKGVFFRANDLAERGLWVPVCYESPRFSTGPLTYLWEVFGLKKKNTPYPQQGTSIITYWAAIEVAERYGRTDQPVIKYMGKTYHQIPRKKAENIFGKQAKFSNIAMGKTHEIVQGSVFFPQWVCPNCRTRNIIGNDRMENPSCSNCGYIYQDADVLKRPSTPPTGSRVLHRHWEISQMCRYLRSKGLLEKFIRGDQY